ncbi:MAG TPA: dihydropteroate synthase [Geminicoccus sp.]|nr:dihydropteroate synthase [Geminicoccus sp.]
MGLLTGATAADAVRAGVGLPFGADRAFTAARVFRRDGERLTEELFTAATLRHPTEPQLLGALEALARPVGQFRIMGVVNVTPDSFSDGGKWLDPDAAVRHGLSLAAAGADILDVGGESTRPGADPVSPDEEVGRIVDVVRSLSVAGHIVSVDTRHAKTMKAALDAGATIVNDVTALRHDPLALALVAEAGCEVILMHSQGEPRTMQVDPHYDRACLDVFDHLEERVLACELAGIKRERITLDPGLGFAKRAVHSLDVLQHLSLFRTLGCPVLIGASRKSMIAHVVGDDALRPDARLPGSLAAALGGLARGASVVRVHDVTETRQALMVARAIDRAP